MNLNNIKQEDKDKLLKVINLILSGHLFNGPLEGRKIAITDLLIFQNAPSNNGYPVNYASGHLQFDHQPIFKILHNEGIIQLDDRYQFKQWKFETNYSALREARDILMNKATKPLPYDFRFTFESVVRDVFNNNIQKGIPTLEYKKFKIKNHLCIKQEIINGVECDGVGRNRSMNIELFLEITSGAITSKHLKKLTERKKIEPNALFWVVGARINDHTHTRLINKGAQITLIKQLTEKYPLFQFAGFGK